MMSRCVAGLDERRQAPLAESLDELGRLGHGGRPPAAPRSIRSSTVSR